MEKEKKDKKRQNEMFRNLILDNDVFEVYHIKSSIDYKVQMKPNLMNCPNIYREKEISNVPKRFVKLKVDLNDLNFECFCVKHFNKTRRLILEGNNLFTITGNRLENSHVTQLIRFLNNNRDIVSLSLAHNKIGDSGFKYLISYLLEYENIYELDIRNNDITATGIDYFYEVGPYLRIKKLQLSSNKFGAIASKNIATLLLKNPYIKHLEVAAVDQTSSSLIYFTTILRRDQLIYNDTLTVLDISRPNPGCMYFFDATHLAHLIGSMLKTNRCLRALYLQKYGFNCHDIESMTVNAKYNKTLQAIDLAGNNIGDHGVESLTEWFIESPIRALILARNIISNHGARAFSYHLPSSKILYLDISFNRITDEGAMDILNSIKKCPPIRSLKMFGNTISHPTANIVKRMLLSKVLTQRNLDIKPYEVDGKLYLAQYSTTCFNVDLICKKKHTKNEACPEICCEYKTLIK